MSFSLILVFLLTSVFQLHFWLNRLDKVNRYTSDDFVETTQPFVSVVIAVRNEGKHLAKHIQMWLDQDFDNYELIIVNDHSTDNTIEALQFFEDERLHFLTLPKEKAGKKEALSRGINEAQGEWILVTDGDCYPESKTWISSIMSHSADNDVILGYSPYLTSSGLLNKWIRYETWYVAMQYLSASILKEAYMGVGRNMAFRKQAFKKVGGYQSHQDVKGGDDDLLIASFGSELQYAIATERTSWVWTYPKTTFAQYLHQKRRHLSTAPRYKPNVRISLILIYVSQFLWYFLAGYLTLLNSLWLIAFVIRYVVIFAVHFRSRRGLADGASSFWVPFFDGALCLSYFVLSFSYLKPKKDW